MGVRLLSGVLSMDKIACAILSVGLCFYQVHRRKVLMKKGVTYEPDNVASFIALIAALVVIF